MESALVAQEARRADLVRLLSDSDRAPYEMFRAALYTPDELMEGWRPGDRFSTSLDGRIQAYALAHGGRTPQPEGEAIAQRIHDHGVDEALRRLLKKFARAAQQRGIVGIMGGSATPRNDPAGYYRRTMEVAQLLTRSGYYVATGGGLGIMEAANLGAYLGREDTAAIDTALHMLSTVPFYDGHESDYILSAQAVRQTFSPGMDSLAIPTWVFPNEPISQFATRIAKYFSNSLREEGLLAIADAGVVFAPGGAGTIQEIFQDAAQNSYGSFGGPSPMVFLGSEHYAHRSPSPFKLVRDQAAHLGPCFYEEKVGVFDDPNEILVFIENHNGG